MHRRQTMPSRQLFVFRRAFAAGRLGQGLALSRLTKLLR